MATPIISLLARIDEARADIKNRPGRTLFFVVVILIVVVLAFIVQN